jgi:cytochrome P450 family 110
MDTIRSPKFSPIAQKLRWAFDPLKLLKYCAQQFGDLFQLMSTKERPVVFVSNPQALKEIFTAEASLFDSGRGNALLQPIFGDFSLLLLDGAPHRRQRRLLLPPFHGDRMRTYGLLMCETTKEVMREWTVGKPFLVRAAMQDIALRIILKAVFGLDSGDRYDELKRLLGGALDTINSPLTSSMLFFPSLRLNLGAWSPWGKFLRMRDQIDTILYSEIRQRRRNLDPSRTDICTLLLQARDEEGQPMSDQELRDELITLLFSGNETTASALAWAVYHIHRNPDVHAQLLDELQALDPDIDPVQLARLPYLNAVCQETLRASPIFLTTQDRILKEPFELLGHQLAKGTVLVPCIYLTHQREDLYPEPDRFLPDRFLQRQFSPYEYVPFGGGNRSCIGMAFAQFEMKLVLATVLSHLQLAPINKEAIAPVRRGATLALPMTMQMLVSQQYRPILDSLPVVSATPPG